MSPRNWKFEIRNKSAEQTTTFNYINWFADLSLFRISRFGFAAALVPAFCSAAMVPINNPSFETTDSTPVSGWGVQPPDTDGGPGGTAETYIYAPTVGYAGADYPDGIPGGVNVAHSDGPIIFQDTTDDVQADTQYTLSIFVGNSAATNDFINYRAVLIANGLVITTDQTKPIPAPGQWALATSTGYVGDNSEMVGYPISIVLEPLGGQVDWDNVVPSDDQPNIPEPAGLGVVGAALAVMGRRRTKSIQG